MHDSKPHVAFLGPSGTYSHQSAYAFFGPEVQYVEEQTISDVFDAVSPEIPFAVIPQENTIFGSVIETYDRLRLADVGQDKFVKGEVTLAVQHCLVVRCGTQLQDIRKVLSHEQALGQCGQFLSEHLPEATLVSMPSTAAAAEAVTTSDEHDGAVAAICSSLCTKLMPDLEVLREGIQDENINFTRFYVLAGSLDAKLPIPPSSSRLRHALVRISAQPPKTDGDPPNTTAIRSVISTLLTSFGLPVLRIDRRPSTLAIPFDDVYFIEFEEPGGPPSPGSTRDTGVADAAWLSRMEAGITRVRAVGCNADLIGIW